MDPCQFPLRDGREVCVAIEAGRWSAWVQGAPDSQVVGFPLEGVLMETLGMNPAHGDPPADVLALAERVRRAIPRSQWPSGRSSQPGR